MTNIVRTLNYDMIYNTYTDENRVKFNEAHVEIGGLYILDSNGILQNLLNLSAKKLTAILIDNKYSLPNVHKEKFYRIKITEKDRITRNIPKISQNAPKKQEHKEIAKQNNKKSTYYQMVPRM